MKNIAKQLVFWLIVLSVLILAAYGYREGEKPKELLYSDFIGYATTGNVKSVVIQDGKITGKLANGQSYTTQLLDGMGTDVTKILIDYNKTAPAERQIKFEVKRSQQMWWSLAQLLLPVLLIVGFWLFIMRQMQMGSNKAMSFGRSRAKLISDGQQKVTFADVAGVDEAKEELQEIIEFLKEPQKFQKLGGRIPRGVLLVGPPGTGKTLLARAVAGEAGVPFFSISGSDFVEMFVGVGASRVRDLFESGKKHAPCIIFIDEIDAVGRQRGAGLGGGHDEREQTLNQLLVEMDGFNTNDGVILMAATNRPDVLDPALLRPGRFDRQIVVDLPDLIGRENILKVHVRKVPLAEGVDLKVIARGTPYFSGADLANLVNEAALLAARRNKKKIEMDDVEEARDKVMMGPERRSRVISEKEKRVTAFHEAGHALVAKLLPGADPVHKVTIIPRGMALGLTHQLPMEDIHNPKKNELLDHITIFFGGRLAEELVFNEASTGASNDLKRATELANRMVCEWGMSEKLGPMTFGHREEHIFLGREISRSKDYSEKTAIEIDIEVRHIIDGCYAKAKDLISTNMDKLNIMADALLERETLDENDVNNIMKGEPLQPYVKEEVETKQAEATPQDTPKNEESSPTIKKEPGVLPA
jgi:cell division protease FtsH